MQPPEWTKVARHPQLDVELLHAYYVQHAYPRHSHDYYVLSLIERGRQSFTHQGTKYRTPPGGLILINPGVVHTGEAADTQGFELRALYPSTSLMETVAYELTGHRAPPFLKKFSLATVGQQIAFHLYTKQSWRGQACWNVSRALYG